MTELGKESKIYLNENHNIVGVMQPYFFPYIGYWQLINAVDKYVIFDDVNYINRGWINRNRILINGEPKYINLPMLGASQNKLINEIKVNLDEKEINKVLNTIMLNYKKAPYYSDVFPLLEEIIQYDNDSLSKYLTNSIKKICNYLDIHTQIFISSEIDKDNTLKGESKILDICKNLGATDYVNAIGGRELYHNDIFNGENITLHFIDTKKFQYKQFRDEFESNLSVIDILMFNDKDRCHMMLDNYSLVENG